METPYAGRAIINDNHDGIEIIIPVKTNWFVLVVSSIWLVGVLSFAIFACSLVQGPDGVNARPFIYGFFSLFIIPWVLTLCRWWWNIAGKELIHVSKDALTIERKGDPFKRTKSYDITQCTNFCAAEVEAPIYYYNNRTVSMFRKRINPGTISFTYDVVDTIQFGEWLSEVEGNYILERLRAKKLIS